VVLCLRPPCSGLPLLRSMEAEWSWMRELLCCVAACDGERIDADSGT